jgi:hypothetical protein
MLTLVTSTPEIGVHPMRLLRSFLLPMLLTALVTACSAPSTSSQDGGEPSTAAQESEGSQPSDAGGGGGGGGGLNGSVQYEITGDYTETGELRFVPEASYFEQAGATYLAFTNEGEQTVLFISLSDGGNNATFGNEEISIASTPENCDFNLTQDDATEKSGTFDCPDSFTVFATGSQQGTLSLKGSFEARQ